MSNSDTNLGMLLNMPIQSVLSADVLILDSDDTAALATDRMKDKNARSVLVTHAGEVIGIVSKTDILFKVMAQGKNPTKVRLREIMTSPVITVFPDSTIGQALQIMEERTVRQVIVTSGTSVIGMVTRGAIVKQIQKTTLSATQTAISGTPVCIINPKAIAIVKDAYQSKFPCPYCGSPFDDKEVLSKHIDRIHGGSGVLEGDVRRMFD